MTVTLDGTIGTATSDPATVIVKDNTEPIDEPDDNTGGGSPSNGTGQAKVIDNFGSVETGGFTVENKIVLLDDSGEGFELESNMEKEKTTFPWLLLLILLLLVVVAVAGYAVWKKNQ
ncbi:hypothetical protein MsAg5_17030 [Methanosarcinaceae archaeon Ag5]|uniref:Uncharacterized protein n=2 Tax=Methanolapillus africanus TaxID=3028297 RepID=A0AAE4SEH6_9EURY|nr:hypothetical protein [Methanosarcinaceae archaeon Ag5]